MTGLSTFDMNGDVHHSSRRVFRGQFAVEMMFERLVSVGGNSHGRLANHGDGNQ
jgi:hypothetical protein